MRPLFNSLNPPQRIIPTIGLRPELPRLGLSPATPRSTAQLISYPDLLSTKPKALLQQEILVRDYCSIFSTLRAKLIKQSPELNL